MRLGRWAIGCLAAAAGGSAAVAVPVMAATGPATVRGGSVTTVTTTTTVAPTATTTTPGPSAPTATADSPAVALRVGFKGSSAVLMLGWKVDGDTSLVTSVHIAGFPQNALLTATCRGASGCPTRVTRQHGHTVTVHRMISARGHQLRRFIDNLLKLRFHAGDRVVFTVKVPGKPTVSTETLVRNARQPVARRLH